MKFDPRIHHRASTRMQGYDYSLAGAYFITIVTYQRQILFGEIVDGTSLQEDHVKLNRKGKIVQDEWFRSAEIRKEIRLFPEEFVVMPNHIHGIVWIVDSQVLGANNIGATGRSPLCTDNHPRGPKPKSLSSFVAGFKSFVTKRMRDELNETGIWQRNYYDRIIRNERELDAIRKYIETNPDHWAEDEENAMMGK